MSWKISKIEIEGFRGVKDKLEIDLDGCDIALFVGSVGSGKTSILSAIEFAFFGTTYEVRERVLRVRDLINRYSEIARVKVTLKGEGKEVTIERVLTKVGRSSASVYENGVKVAEKSDEVEKYLSDVLGCSPDSFWLRHSITSRSIDSLIYSTVYHRSILLDKALGLDILERIHRAIQLTQIDKVIEELERSEPEARRAEVLISRYGTRDLHKVVNELEAKKAELEKELKLVDERLAKVKEELDRLGKVRGKYWKIREELTRVRSEYDEVVEKLDSLRREFGELHVAEVVAVLSRILTDIASKLEENLMVDYASKVASYEVSEEALDDAIVLADEALKKLEDRLTQLHEELVSIENEIGKRRGELERLKMELAAYTAQLNRLKSLRAEYEKLSAKYGTSSDVRKRIKEIETKLSSASAEETELSSAITVLTRLVRDLTSAGEGECLACGTKFGKVAADKLRERLRELSRKLESIRQDLPKLSKELEELRLVLPKLESMEKQIASIERIEGSVEELKRRIESLYEELSNLESVKRDVEERIRDLATFIGATRKRLEEVEAYINYAQLLRRKEELERRLAELEKELAGLGYDPVLVEKLSKEYTKLSERKGNLLAQLRVVESDLKVLKDLASRIHTRTLDTASKLARLRVLREKLVKIRHALLKVQSSVRMHAIERLSRLLSSYVPRLYPEMNIVSALVKLETSRTREAVRTVYNFYVELESGNVVPAFAVLSDGQKALLMLATLLSVLNIVSPKLKFSALDEPLPTIDLESRRAVADTLAKVSAIQDLQLLFATNDDRIVDLMREAIPSGLTLRVFRVRYFNRTVLVSMTK